MGRLLSIVVTLLISSAVYAQAEVPTTETSLPEAEGALDSIFKLYQADVVSTGSFLDLSLKQSSASLTIIQREKINTSGARTLSELLEIFVPGFHYALGKWHGTTWGMRGVSDTDLEFIFLVNGIKENMEAKADPAAEGMVGLMQDIERVEVLRGPAGLAYGASAIAGVINVVTRQPVTNTSEARVVGGPRAIEVQGFSHVQLGENHGLTLTAGWGEDFGVGLHAARIYGQGSYPTTTGLIHKDGIPSEGSAFATPGNTRLGVDWRWHELRVWARWTHQVFDNAGLFAQDPWPGIVGSPPAGAPPGSVDGQKVSPTGPWVPVDSLGLGRMLYSVDNITLALHYEVPVDTDRINLDAAWIGVTNRQSIDLLNAFAVPTAISNFPAGTIYLSLGERRYFMSGTYLLKRIPHFQSGSGVQVRFDDIGSDLEGNNMFNSIARHTAITPVLYTNLALFSENSYAFNDTVSVVAGVRLDYHTRTGVQFNPKVAALYAPGENHIIKLILQSSSGNNSAYNYEPNYYRYSDAGTLNTTSTLANPTGTTVIPPASIATLHALRPLRSLSVELTSTHWLWDGLSVTPSVSFNRFNDLAEFSQVLFRSVNSGEYNALNIEVDALYDYDFLSFGANHAFQRPVGNSIADQTFSIPTTNVQRAPNGTYTVSEVPGSFQQVSVNAIKDGVTLDGTDFLNLATHVTKLWISMNLPTWLTVHANLRILWGVPGRHTLWAADEAQGENYLQVDTLPMFKLNVGATAQVPLGFTVSAFAYDLLGNGHSRQGVRWQQITTGGFREVYTSDQPTFVLRVEKSF